MPLSVCMELPTLFIDIDAEGSMQVQPYCFKRCTGLHYGPCTPLNSFLDGINRIYEEGNATTCEYRQFMDDFVAFEQGKEQMAFATVSLRRNIDGTFVNHGTVMLFHKTDDGIVLEYFDGRGKDLAVYSHPKHRHFYDRRKMLQVLQSLGNDVVRWSSLARRMLRQPPASSLTIDYMDRLDDTFSITNPNECRSIALTYLYHRLRRDYTQLEAASVTKDVFGSRWGPPEVEAH